jgi:hypothetical protein
VREDPAVSGNDEISTKQLLSFRAILRRSGATGNDLEMFSQEYQRVVDAGHSIDTAVDNLLARFQLIIARRRRESGHTGVTDRFPPPPDTMP